MSFKLKKSEKNEIREFLKKVNFSNLEFPKRIKMMMGIDDLSIVKELRLSLSSSIQKNSKNKKFSFEKKSKNINVKTPSDVLPTDYDFGLKTTERDLIPHHHNHNFYKNETPNNKGTGMITGNLNNPNLNHNALDMSNLSEKSKGDLDLEFQEKKNAKKNIEKSSENEDYWFTFSCFCIKFSGKRRTSYL